MAKRKLVERPYNNGTMSVAAFWGMIRGALRQKSRWWKPIAEVKRRARRKYKGANKRQKYEYQCSKCKGWFADKNVEVDHVNPCGMLRSGDDLKGFVERLFCEAEGLVVLCKKCHLIKTKAEKDGRK